MRYIVGSISGYDVIYLPEKDVLFCKNTVVPYNRIDNAVYSRVDREKIPEKNLTITKGNGGVQLGCLYTSLSNINNIKQNILKIKNHGNTDCKH